MKNRRAPPKSSPIFCCMQISIFSIFSHSLAQPTSTSSSYARIADNTLVLPSVTKTILLLWSGWGWGPAACDSYCIKQSIFFPIQRQKRLFGQTFLFLPLKFLKGRGGTSFQKFPHIPFVPYFNFFGPSTSSRKYDASISAMQSAYAKGNISSARPT